MESLRHEKESLRQKVKSLRGKVTISLGDFFKVHSEFKTIGAFREMNDEPNLKDFPEDAELCWPQIIDEAAGVMSFYSSASFRKSLLGFEEPSQGLEVSKSKIQVVLVPGQAFDFKGSRLGRGKGYYDRFLKNFTGVKVGICSHERFLLEPVPVNECDVSVDWVLTESIIYRVNEKAV